MDAVLSVAQLLTATDAALGAFDDDPSLITVADGYLHLLVPQELHPLGGDKRPDDDAALPRLRTYEAARPDALRRLADRAGAHVLLDALRSIDFDAALLSAPPPPPSAEEWDALRALTARVVGRLVDVREALCPAVVVPAAAGDAKAAPAAAAPVGLVRLEPRWDGLRTAALPALDDAVAACRRHASLMFDTAPLSPLPSSSLASQDGGELAAAAAAVGPALRVWLERVAGEAGALRHALARRRAAIDLYAALGTGGPRKPHRLPAGLADTADDDDLVAAAVDVSRLRADKLEAAAAAAAALLLAGDAAQSLDDGTSPAAVASALAAAPPPSSAVEAAGASELPTLTASGVVLAAMRRCVLRGAWGGLQSLLAAPTPSTAAALLPQLSAPTARLPAALVAVDTAAANASSSAEPATHGLAACIAPELCAYAATVDGRRLHAAGVALVASAAGPAALAEWIADVTASYPAASRAAFMCATAASAPRLEGGDAAAAADGDALLSGAALLRLVSQVVLPLRTAAEQAAASDRASDDSDDDQQALFDALGAALRQLGDDAETVIAGAPLALPLLQRIRNELAQAASQARERHLSRRLVAALLAALQSGSAGTALAAVLDDVPAVAAVAPLSPATQAAVHASHALLLLLSADATPAAVVHTVRDVLRAAQPTAAPEAAVAGRQHHWLGALPADVAAALVERCRSMARAAEGAEAAERLTAALTAAVAFPSPSAPLRHAPLVADADVAAEVDAAATNAEALLRDSGDGDSVDPVDLAALVATARHLLVLRRALLVGEWRTAQDSLQTLASATPAAVAAALNGGGSCGDAPFAALLAAAQREVALRACLASVASTFHASAVAAHPCTLGDAAPPSAAAALPLFQVVPVAPPSLVPPPVSALMAFDAALTALQQWAADAGGGHRGAAAAAPVADEDPASEAAYVNSVASLLQCALRLRFAASEREPEEAADDTDAAATSYESELGQAASEATFAAATVTPSKADGSDDDVDLLAGYAGAVAHEAAGVAAYLREQRLYRLLRRATGAAAATPAAAATTSGSQPLARLQAAVDAAAAADGGVPPSPGAALLLSSARLLLTLRPYAAAGDWEGVQLALDATLLASPPPLVADASSQPSGRAFLLADAVADEVGGLVATAIHRRLLLPVLLSALLDCRVRPARKRGAQAASGNPHRQRRVDGVDADLNVSLGSAFVPTSSTSSSAAAGVVAGMSPRAAFRPSAASSSSSGGGGLASPARSGAITPLRRLFSPFSRGAAARAITPGSASSSSQALLLSPSAAAFPVTLASPAQRYLRSPAATAAGTQRAPRRSVAVDPAAVDVPTLRWALALADTRGGHGDTRGAGDTASLLSQLLRLLVPARVAVATGDTVALVACLRPLPEGFPSSTAASLHLPAAIVAAATAEVALLRQLVGPAALSPSPSASPAAAAARHAFGGRASPTTAGRTQPRSPFGSGGGSNSPSKSPRDGAAAGGKPAGSPTTAAADEDVGFTVLPPLAARLRRLIHAGAWAALAQQLVWLLPRLYPPSLRPQAVGYAAAAGSDDADDGAAMLAGLYGAAAVLDPWTAALLEGCAGAPHPPPGVCDDDVGALRAEPAVHREVQTALSHLRSRLVVRGALAAMGLLAVAGSGSAASSSRLRVANADTAAVDRGAINVLPLLPVIDACTRLEAGAPPLQPYAVAALSAARLARDLRAALLLARDAVDDDGAAMSLADGGAHGDDVAACLRRARQLGLLPRSAYIGDGKRTAAVTAPADDDDVAADDGGDDDDDWLRGGPLRDGGVDDGDENNGTRRRVSPAVSQQPQQQPLARFGPLIAACAPHELLPQAPAAGDSSGASPFASAMLAPLAGDAAAAYTEWASNRCVSGLITGVQAAAALQHTPTTGPTAGLELQAVVRQLSAAVVLARRLRALSPECRRWLAAAEFTLRLLRLAQGQAWIEVRTALRGGPAAVAAVTTAVTMLPALRGLLRRLDNTSASRGVGDAVIGALAQGGPFLRPEEADAAAAAADGNDDADGGSVVSGGSSDVDDGVSATEAAAPPPRVRLALSRVSVEPLQHALTLLQREASTVASRRSAPTIDSLMQSPVSRRAHPVPTLAHQLTPTLVTRLSACVQAVAAIRAAVAVRDWAAAEEAVRAAAALPPVSEWLPDDLLPPPMASAWLPLPGDVPLFDSGAALLGGGGAVDDGNSDAGSDDGDGGAVADDERAPVDVAFAGLPHPVARHEAATVWRHARLVGLQARLVAALGTGGASGTPGAVIPPPPSGVAALSALLRPCVALLAGAHPLDAALAGPFADAVATASLVRDVRAALAAGQVDAARQLLACVADDSGPHLVASLPPVAAPVMPPVEADDDDDDDGSSDGGHPGGGAAAAAAAASVGAYRDPVSGGVGYFPPGGGAGDAGAAVASSTAAAAGEGARTFPLHAAAWPELRLLLDDAHEEDAARRLTAALEAPADTAVPSDDGGGALATPLADAVTAACARPLHTLRARSLLFTARVLLRLRALRAAGDWQGLLDALAAARQEYLDLQAGSSGGGPADNDNSGGGGDGPALAPFAPSATPEITGLARQALVAVVTAGLAEALASGSAALRSDGGAAAAALPPLQRLDTSSLTVAPLEAALRGAERGLGLPSHLASSGDDSTTTASAAVPPIIALGRLVLRVRESLLLLSQQQAEGEPSHDLAALLVSEQAATLLLPPAVAELLAETQPGRAPPTAALTSQPRPALASPPQRPRAPRPTPLQPPFAFPAAPPPPRRPNTAPTGTAAAARTVTATAPPLPSATAAAVAAELTAVAHVALQLHARRRLAAALSTTADVVVAAAGSVDPAAVDGASASLAAAAQFAARVAACSPAAATSQADVAAELAIADLAAVVQALITLAPGGADGSGADDGSESQLQSALLAVAAAEAACSSTDGGVHAGLCSAACRARISLDAATAVALRQCAAACSDLLEQAVNTLRSALDAAARAVEAAAVAGALSHAAVDAFSARVAVVWQPLCTLASVAAGLCLAGAGAGSVEAARAVDAAAAEVRQLLTAHRQAYGPLAPAVSAALRALAGESAAAQADSVHRAVAAALTAALHSHGPTGAEPGALDLSACADVEPLVAALQAAADARWPPQYGGLPPPDVAQLTAAVSALLTVRQRAAAAPAASASGAATASPPLTVADLLPAGANTDDLPPSVVREATLLASHFSEVALASRLAGALSARVIVGDLGRLSVDRAALVAVADAVEAALLAPPRSARGRRLLALAEAGVELYGALVAPSSDAGGTTGGGSGDWATVVLPAAQSLQAQLEQLRRSGGGDDALPTLPGLTADAAALACEARLRLATSTLAGAIHTLCVAAIGTSFQLEQQPATPSTVDDGADVDAIRRPFLALADAVAPAVSALSAALDSAGEAVDGAVTAGLVAPASVTQLAALGTGALSFAVAGLRYLRRCCALNDTDASAAAAPLPPHPQPTDWRPPQEQLSALALHTARAAAAPSPTGGGTTARRAVDGLTTGLPAACAAAHAALVLLPAAARLLAVSGGGGVVSGPVGEAAVSAAAVTELRGVATALRGAGNATPLLRHAADAALALQTRDWAGLQRALAVCDGGATADAVPTTGSAADAAVHAAARRLSSTVAAFARRLRAEASIAAACDALRRAMAAGSLYDDGRRVADNAAEAGLDRLSGALDGVHELVAHSGGGVASASIATLLAAGHALLRARAAAVAGDADALAAALEDAFAPPAAEGAAGTAAATAHHALSLSTLSAIPSSPDDDDGTGGHEHAHKDDDAAAAAAGAASDDFLPHVDELAALAQEAQAHAAVNALAAALAAGAASGEAGGALTMPPAAWARVDGACRALADSGAVSQSATATSAARLLRTAAVVRRLRPALLAFDSLLAASGGNDGGDVSDGGALPLPLATATRELVAALQPLAAPEGAPSAPLDLTTATTTSTASGRSQQLPRRQPLTGADQLLQYLAVPLDSASLLPPSVAAEVVLARDHAVALLLVRRLSAALAVGAPAVPAGSGPLGGLDVSSVDARPLQAALAAAYAAAAALSSDGRQPTWQPPRPLAAQVRACLGLWALRRALAAGSPGDAVAVATALCDGGGVRARCLRDAEALLLSPAPQGAAFASSHKRGGSSLPPSPASHTASPFLPPLAEEEEEDGENDGSLTGAAPAAAAAVADEAAQVRLRLTAGDTLLGALQAAQAGLNACDLDALDAAVASARRVGVLDAASASAAGLMADVAEIFTEAAARADELRAALAGLQEATTTTRTLPALEAALDRAAQVGLAGAPAGSACAVALADARRLRARLSAVHARAAAALAAADADALAECQSAAATLGAPLPLATPDAAAAGELLALPAHEQLRRRLHAAADAGDADTVAACTLHLRRLTHAAGVADDSDAALPECALLLPALRPLLAGAPHAAAPAEQPPLPPAVSLPVCGDPALLAGPAPRLARLVASYLAIADGGEGGQGDGVDDSASLLTDALARQVVDTVKAGAGDDAAAHHRQALLSDELLLRLLLLLASAAPLSAPNDDDATTPPPPLRLLAAVLAAGVCPSEALEPSLEGWLLAPRLPPRLGEPLLLALYAGLFRRATTTSTTTATSS